MLLKSKLRPPSPLPPQRSGDSTPECKKSRTQGFVSSQLPGGGLSSRRSRTSAFLILPPAACCWGCILGKCGWEVGAPFFLPRHTCAPEALSWVWPAENIGDPELFPGLMRWWFQAKRIQPRTSQVATLPSFKCLTPGMRVSEKSLPLNPLLAPEPWLRFCPKWEADCEMRICYSLPKGTDFTCNRGWRSLSLRALSRTAKVW